jgi:hypothetical protein
VPPPPKRLCFRPAYILLGRLWLTASTPDFNLGRPTDSRGGSEVAKFPGSRVILRPNKVNHGVGNEVCASFIRYCTRECPPRLREIWVDRRGSKTAARPMPCVSILLRLVQNEVVALALRPVIASALP